MILVPIWILTKENFLADLLSRGRLDILANEYPMLQISKGLETHHFRGTARSL